ncbi:hypothetical protein ACIPWF_00620 [Paenarthrobacter sp. NPDC089989]|uniref:hypothetical protein n=1 Tax=unclassified Paenarthrobacter TaxID=2634190 RepID=UPI0037F5BC78
MSGYRVLNSAEAVATRPDHLLGHGSYTQRHCVEIVAWNEEPASLIAIQSGYGKDMVEFEVQDLDLLIELLQQAKALLEAEPKDPGAVAPSPAAAAPVTTPPAEER